MQIEQIKIFWTGIKDKLNEKQKRHCCAQYAIALGYGGIKIVSKATSVSAKTISKGIRELAELEKNPDPDYLNHIRNSNSGRTKITSKIPEVKNIIREILDTYSYGDPMTNRMYCSKSTRKIKKVLKSEDYNVSHATIGSIIREMGFSLKKNKKQLCKSNNPHRNKIFNEISKVKREFLDKDLPVWSIDAKKRNS